MGQLKETKTAKKKKQVVSPYDLEYNNKFLKNTFQLELIMDLEEQRRSRPTEYRIRNFKKAARLPRRKPALQKDVPRLHQPLRAKRSVSPDPDRLPEELSSGKSASPVHDEDRRGYAARGKRAPHFSSQMADKSKPFNMLAEQPKHLRDPLKFAKPFEIKTGAQDRGKKDARGRRESRLRSAGPDAALQEPGARARSDDEDAAALNHTASSAKGRLRPVTKLETPQSRQREKMYLTQGGGFRAKGETETQVGGAEGQRSRGK